MASGPRIRSKIRTKVIDHGYKAIIRELKVLENEPCIKVGLPKESDKTKEEYKDGDAGTTVLDVGVWHEFGTETLPERSWLRSSHDAQLSEMNALIKRVYIAVIEGRITVSRALGIMGIIAEKNTKKFISDNKVQPPSKKGDFSLVKFGKVSNANSKAPVKETKRTSFKTLIDTAQLLNSITFVKVMNKNGLRN